MNRGFHTPGSSSSSGVSGAPGAPGISHVQVGDLLSTGALVLVPRGGEPGDRLAQCVRAAGFTPLIEPLIHFIEPSDPGPLQAELRAVAAGNHDWLILTSERTVDALLRWAPDKPLGASCEKVRVAAVGPSTARRAMESGIKVDLIPVWEKSARGLIADLTALGPASALIPHSNLARPELGRGLRAAGWDVREVEAYRTMTAVRLTAQARRADVVLLTSSSTATTWARLRDPGHSPLFISIGPRTTETAVELGLPVAATAPEPTVEALTETLTEVIEAIRGAGDSTGSGDSSSSGQAGSTGDPRGHRSP